MMRFHISVRKARVGWAHSKEFIKLQLCYLMQIAWTVPAATKQHACGRLLNCLPCRMFVRFVCPRKRAKANVASNN